MVAAGHTCYKETQVHRDTHGIVPDVHSRFVSMSMVENEAGWLIFY